MSGDLLETFRVSRSSKGGKCCLGMIRIREVWNLLSLFIGLDELFSETINSMKVVKGDV